VSRLQELREARQIPWVRALGLYVAVRVIVLGVLVLAARVADRDVLRVLTGWDAGWYAGIAEKGYGTVVHHPDGRLLSDYAFFPLFPVTERILRVAIGSDFAVAGLAVAVISSVVAAVGIYRIGELLKGERAAMLLVLLWAAVPVGAVQWMSYTESLFTALAAWSLYCVLRGRWAAAGWLCLLAGLTRPTGAALVAAVVVAALLDLRRSPRRPWERVRAILLAPLGLLGYLLFVASRTHDLFGYFTVTRGWDNGIDVGVGFLGRLDTMLAAPSPWPGLAIIAGVVALGALIRWAHRDGLPLPLLVYTVGIVVLAFVTSGYLGSKPRYLLPAFPLLLPIAGWLAGRRMAWQAAAAATAVVVAAAYGAVWLLGPGPP
jgi:hypothetical protein